MGQRAVLLRTPGSTTLGKGSSTEMHAGMVPPGRGRYLPPLGGGQPHLLRDPAGLLPAAPAEITTPGAVRKPWKRGGGGPELAYPAPPPHA